MTKSEEAVLAELAAKAPHFAIAPFRKALVNWYLAHERPLPWRVLWRKFQDPYHIWVSEVMLQQTLIQAVLPAYERFLTAFPSLWDLARADESAVREAVRGLGYYRRFKFLHAGAKQLYAVAKQVAPAKSEVPVVWPQGFAAWKAVPGVGTYTAAAITSIAFQQAKAVVDGNVERVFCRLFDIRLPPNLPALKKRFQELGDKLIDPRAPAAFNQGLMELGQTVCTVASPSCSLCPLRAQCLAFGRKSVALAPGPKLKKTAVEVSLRLTIVTHARKVCLTTRPKDARFLKEAQGFLTSIKGTKLYRADGSQKKIEGLPALRNVGVFKHSITNHRLTVEVCLAELKVLPAVGPLAASEGLWLKPEGVEARLLANLDRKAWLLLQKYSRTPKKVISPLHAANKPSRIMAENPLF